MLLPKPAMWFAAVDYLRGTIRTKRNEATESLIIRELERIAGNTVIGPYEGEPFSFMGFRGVRFGPVGWGWRDDVGYMVQGSGISAAALFDVRLPYTNVARIDVQATFWYDKYQRDVAEKAFKWSSASRIGRRGRPWKVQYRNGGGDGDTTYLGRRGKKSKLARIYDKWKESEEAEEYLNAWRFEWEFSDCYARDVYGTLLDTGAGPGVCAALVARYLKEWGVTLHDVSDVALFDVHRIPKDVGSVERRLRWLETQVSPTIDKLVASGVSFKELGRVLGLVIAGTD